MQESDSSLQSKACFDVLRSFGKAVGQLGLYNQPNHPSVILQLNEMAETLSGLFQTNSTLVYVMMGDQVLVNGRIIGHTSQVPGNVRNILTRHKLQSLTFRPGFTVEDITVLCSSMISRPGHGAKSPAQTLVDKGIRTIGLNEAEISVHAKELKAASASGVGDRAGEEAAGAGKPNLNAQFVRTQFGRYMSPELVERLAAAHQSLQLGGETRTITVMFADLRGFTTLSEDLLPKETTRLLNSFLTPMTRILLEHDGFIDKYMGDAVMAFWNAPLTDEKHAERACAAALAMRDRLAALNLAWMGAAQARGAEHKPIKMGIGINTGPACVGNVGSEQRFEYSAIGDCVNLASRLEGQSKIYGIDIILGEETTASAPGFAFLELDVVRVKGKTRNTRLFGLLGDHELAQSDEFKRLAALHRSFLKAFRNQQWNEAERMLGACLATGFPPAAFCNLYRARIGRYRRHPPPPDWDGSTADRRK